MASPLAFVSVGDITKNPDDVAVYRAPADGSAPATLVHYVISFPDAQAKFVVSRGGGTEPKWSRSGRELFFESGGMLKVVDVPAGPTFAPGNPRTLGRLSPRAQPPAVRRVARWPALCHDPRAGGDHGADGGVRGALADGAVGENEAVGEPIVRPVAASLPAALPVPRSPRDPSDVRLHASPESATAGRAVVRRDRRWKSSACGGAGHHSDRRR